MSQTAMVIFGITGDLARRKLIPALYNLIKADRLPEELCIIGFARRKLSDDDLSRLISESVAEFSDNHQVDAKALKALQNAACYISSTFENEQGYRQLADQLNQEKVTNAVYYLATPPEEYIPILERMEKFTLCHSKRGWRRIVVEKPYGSDLDSAVKLEEVIHRGYDEDQIYRIDHYLGKDTVQNILVLRFANGILEPLWNQHYVDHVEITAAEQIGIGSRADYYDDAGVIRDVFQNHMLQLLTLTAMEAPVAFNANAVRDEKLKVLHSLRQMSPKDVMSSTVHGQYTASKVDGQKVNGYLDEPGVVAKSTTETYLAVEVFIDNWRWSGVPFYLRAGKRLAKSVTQIVVQFKQVPLPLFGWKNMAGAAPNMLCIVIQPNEGISLSFGAKAPGEPDQIEPVKMEFDYTKTFKMEPPDAYLRLIQDVFEGDATLFPRRDEVLAAWKYTTDILKAWQANPNNGVHPYRAGTWGPAAAEKFIQRSDRKWMTW